MSDAQVVEQSAAEVDESGRRSARNVLVGILATGVAGLLAVYLVGDRDMYTMALGLATFKDEFDQQWALWMAASVVMTVPMIVLFFFAQRFFIEGVTTSGLKG